MECREKENLTAFLDGELCAVEEARVRVHLETCGECSRQAALLKHSYEALDCLNVPELSRPIRAGAGGITLRKRLFAVAAVAAAVFMAAIFALRGPLSENGVDLIAARDLSEIIEAMEHEDILDDISLLAEIETFVSPETVNIAVIDDGVAADMEFISELEALVGFDGSYDV